MQILEITTARRDTKLRAVGRTATVKLETKYSFPEICPTSNDVLRLMTKVLPGSAGNFNAHVVRKFEAGNFFQPYMARLLARKQVSHCS